MFIKYMLFLISLWSCIHAHAAPTNAFTLVGNDYKTNGATTEIPNMPRQRSQDSLGVCFGFSSATVAQHYICRSKNIQQCNKVSPKDEISPLSAVAWANTNDPAGGAPEARNHSNIRFGGSGVKALGNSSRSFLFYSEACYPFDQFANKYGNNSAAVDEVITRLEKQYNDYKKSEADFCESCFSEDLNKLNISANADALKVALNEANFSEFLFRAYFQNCKDIVRHRPTPKFEYFPAKEKYNSAKANDYIEEAKKQLSQQRPVVLDGICIEKEGGKCQTYHSVVISGYRKVCKSSSDCRTLFKVQNSWGDDWQRRHNDGWVDATALMDGVPGNGLIGWYE